MFGLSTNSLKPLGRHARRDLPFILGLVAVVLAAAAVVRAQAGSLSIVSGPSAGSVTENTAIITWTTDRAATSLVMFGETSALGQTYRKIVPIEETEIIESAHSISLAELNAETTYYYQVRSVAEDGAAAQSAVATFKTLAPAVVVTPLESAKLTKPTADASFTAGADGTVKVEVMATVVGAAEKLEFRVKTKEGADAGIIAGVTSNTGWAGAVSLKAGSYVVVAWGHGKDAAGADVTRVSGEVAFTVKAAPTVVALESVKLTKPASGASFEAGTTGTAKIELSATVTGAADKVEFQAKTKSGTSVGTYAGKAAGVVWTASADLKPGDYVLTAIGSGKQADGTATTKISGAVSFSVAAPPVAEPEPESVIEEPVKPVIPETPTQPEEPAPPVAEQPSETAGEPAPPAGETGGESPAPAPAPTSASTIEGNYAPAIAAAPVSEGLKQEAVALISEIAGAAAPTTGAAPTLGDNRCAENGIIADKCPGWLKAKYADKKCSEAGIVTKKKCEAFLIGGNNGVFPGCENLTEEQCAEIKALALTGYLSDETKEKTDKVVEAAISEGVVLALPEVTPISPDAAGNADWYPSVVAEGGESSAAVIISDADHDGLPDGLEPKYGTDPANADTDGDGASDGDEVKAGTDPTGQDKPVEPPSPVEEAMFAGKPIEQPTVSGEIDPAYSAAPAAGAAGGVALTGTCDPGAVCLVYIYSYIPMVLTVSADANGNWQYDLGENVVDGEHSVYVALADDEGRIAKKSNPLALFVSEATAVTAADFLQPTAAPTAVGGVVAGYQNYYLLGTVVLVVVALIFAAVFVLRPKKQTL